MRALEPTKIIHSKGGGPHAYITTLGWSVVGPINCMSKGITRICNHAAVRDVASSKLASYHFTMEKSVKDVSLEEMPQAMYWHEFSNPELVGSSTMLKCDEVSQEDKKFMKINERKTSRNNNHYVVPSPFCDSNIMLPNNKKQAIQRLMGLKGRFTKDNKFFQDYFKFMANLLELAMQKGQMYHHLIREDVVYLSPWSVPSK